MTSYGAGRGFSNRRIVKLPPAHGAAEMHREGRRAKDRIHENEWCAARLYLGSGGGISSGKALSVVSLNHDQMASFGPAVNGAPSRWPNIK